MLAGTALSDLELAMLPSCPSDHKIDLCSLVVHLDEDLFDECAHDPLLQP